VSLIGQPHAELADNPRSIDDFEEIERDVVRRLAESQQTPPPKEAVNRVLRRLVGLLLDELRTAQGAISSALERETYWPRNAGLKSDRWVQVGSDLVEHGLVDAHGTVSAAYARMDALNQDALDTWSAMEAHYGYDPPPGRPPTIKGNEEAFQAALVSISAAENALLQTRPELSAPSRSF